MIVLENVTKNFNGNLAINEVSLSIEKGENLAIIGANGSGKTTLVEMICGIQNPTSGKISFKNGINDIVGIQFQEGSWPPKTRPIDLLEFFKGKKWKDEEYVNKIFKIFEIESILKKDINKLSGGQKQRLNCFLAIINNPTLIVIDELITGLDLKMQIRLLKYFQTLKEKKEVTMIIVSHISDEIESLCDRVVVLKEGKIFEDNSLKEIVKNYKNIRNYLEKYFDESNDENK
ncbi:ABC transporter ATP-binding protein [Spiroplasma endosymbiont of Diplazon laetatorius]|uniref:ABC transporter ATP-binding protein n=1 Tax=Spiroplasma endosymbiont of Diplazon laetatorius TaxID=3066322 RepID=UPI0030CFB0D8